MDLGKSLKVALAIKGVMNKELAEKLNVKTQQVTNWIRRGKIKQSYLIAICELLEMSVSEFIALGE